MGRHHGRRAVAAVRPPPRWRREMGGGGWCEMGGGCVDAARISIFDVVKECSSLRVSLSQFLAPGSVRERAILFYSVLLLAG